MSAEAMSLPESEFEEMRLLKLVLVEGQMDEEEPEDEVTPYIDPKSGGERIRRIDPIPDIAYQDKANCRGSDPELFFPERGASTKAAKAICRECVVREQCLEFAIVVGEKFGIWGEMSEQQRRPLRKARREAAK